MHLDLDMLCLIAKLLIHVAALRNQIGIRQLIWRKYLKLLINLTIAYFSSREYINGDEQFLIHTEMTMLQHIWSMPESWINFMSLI